MWMVMINIIEKIIPVLLGGGLVGSFMTFFMIPYKLERNGKERLLHYMKNITVSNFIQKYEFRSGKYD